jgi:single-stranded-DNA-specific exonuclease
VAEEAGCSLIVALDCGIRSVDKVNYALEKNIDFVICDHHLPGTLLPEAFAILDPKQSDCGYPYKELSGCGIGFKLIQALHERNPNFPDPTDLLDLVATSIAADIVPITGENRILAFHGLHKVNQNPRPGLKALLVPSKELAGDSGQSSSPKEFTIGDLVFTAAPRINAAGRIDHGKKAVELLLSESLQEASEAVFFIHQHNATRRTLDQQITSEALSILENNSDTHANILYQPHWHKGVVGIVASRVMETFYRPTLVLTESNGKITGSARSVRDFDIHEAIAACGDLLEQFGGHKYAAGLTMKPENFEEFSIRFEQVVAASIKPEQKIPVIDIDLELDPIEITPKFYRVMKQLAPFGPGNMTPVFIARGLSDDGSARIVGTNHLKLRLGKAGQPYFDAIAFNMGELLPSFSMGIPADVCYTLDENYWNGKSTLQWVVKDIRF